MWPWFMSQTQSVEYHCPWSNRTVTVRFLTCGEEQRPVGLVSCSQPNCEMKCLSEAGPASVALSPPDQSDR
jgi:hypothetical protein